MQVIEKHTQANLKTNSDLLEKAKTIIKKNNALPFETGTGKDKAEVLAELRAEIAKSFDDIESGRVYNISEVRASLGIK